MGRLSGFPGAARARAHIDRLTSSGELPGIQYRVLGPDGEIFSSAAGARDVATGQAMEHSTLQMAYSTTKAVTAIAAMQLVDSAASRTTMFSPQRTRDGRALEHTLGWVVGRVAGERYFGKQGGGLGFHGNLRVYPERRLATALLANRTEISPGPIDARTDALDALFLG